ncbi:sigma-70 family RNA polymerase sigma factor [Phytopseudomonas dryadis]|uniref:RNA polymerase subunit sigma-24 n=1 Tax=Phytopseudomonas dryadis TaxID=2487520 RepID=A0A4Q9R954_9GAMM|nr:MULTISPECIES: sigma-70 family RNA polymerase sigma factor [Pseudomonas]TBU97179.1 RNA polymerase subunit sigma-24 [Pseudomonas dryadis]TBV08661.1 RNA polymerase subunit sigma-24 [Pseudomonas dryadis]TBV13933.1 RNA polymerase subunit sigma-24 [Pseudomonas sp. FRB 230]
MPEHSDNLELYLAHRAALVDYAAPIVGCRAQAEDVVQEAWLRFNRRSPHNQPLSQPVGYLYRIVRNLALDLNRRLTLEKCQPDGDQMLDELAAPTPSPEREALYRDELRVLQEALAQLPERTRSAFHMHRLLGLTFQDIAARLGISVSLAHQLVRDALTHCAEQLGDDD